MDLAMLESHVNEWWRRNFPGTPQHRPMLGIGEEYGELLGSVIAVLEVGKAIGKLDHAVLKREQGIRGTPEEHAAAIRDAVGDIVVFLIQFCAIEGITLTDCLSEVWECVRQRDWTKNKVDGGVRRPDPTESPVATGEAEAT